MLQVNFNEKYRTHGVRRRMCEDIMRALKEIHWLLVKYRITFRTVLVYSIKNTHLLSSTPATNPVWNNWPDSIRDTKTYIFKRKLKHWLCAGSQEGTVSATDEVTQDKAVACAMLTVLQLLYVLRIALYCDSPELPMYDVILWDSVNMESRHRLRYCCPSDRVVWASVVLLCWHHLPTWLQLQVLWNSPPTYFLSLYALSRIVVLPPPC